MVLTNKELRKLSMYHALLNLGKPDLKIENGFWFYYFPDKTTKASFFYRGKPLAVDCTGLDESPFNVPYSITKDEMLELFGHETLCTLQSE